MENTDEVVSHAINLMALLGWTVGGAAVGVAVAVVILLLTLLLSRRSRTLNAFRRRTRAPFLATLLFVGALTGYSLADVPETSGLYLAVKHGLLLAVIACLGWFFYASCGLLQDVTHARLRRDARDAQRMQTQSQVLQRVLQTIVVIATLVVMLLTFPAARAPLASLLGAAGIVSVVTGLAAQSTLGNMFAGIQLAFTDAIRVGDTVTVSVGGTEEVGVIEELTLTYVVLRIWNERRVLLPSNYFTGQAFENWTRTGADQLGKVEIHFDWPVPMAQIRQEVQRILVESELWDHRTWNVQMTDSLGTSATVRVVLSAATPGDRWDLECEVREKLVAWACREIPWALPRLRTVPEEVHVVNRDVSDQRVAELAEDLQRITAANSRQDSAEIPVQDDAVAARDPLHAARLRASRRKAKQARRRSVLHRPAGPPQAPTALDSTRVITDPTMVAGDLAPAHRSAPDPTATASLADTDGDGTRLYSGSADAEARRALFAGPGEDVIRQREETIVMQALDARGQIPPPPEGDSDGKRPKAQKETSDD